MGRPLRLLTPQEYKYVTDNFATKTWEQLASKLRMSIPTLRRNFTMRKVIVPRTRIPRQKFGQNYGDLRVLNVTHESGNDIAECICKCGQKCNRRLDKLAAETHPHCGKCGGMNRRDLSAITYQGETKSLSEWAQDPRCEVKRPTLYARYIKTGDIGAALTMPNIRYVTINGVSRTIPQWAAHPKCQFTPESIRLRLAHGMSPKRAVFGVKSKGGRPRLQNNA